VGIRSLRWTFSGRGRSTKEIRLVEATEGERSPSVCAVGDTERWLSFPALEDAGTSGLERGLEGRPCRWEDLAFLSHVRLMLLNVDDAQKRID